MESHGFQIMSDFSIITRQKNVLFSESIRINQQITFKRIKQLLILNFLDRTLMISIYLQSGKGLNGTMLLIKHQNRKKLRVHPFVCNSEFLFELTKL